MRLIFKLIVFFFLFTSISSADLIRPNSNLKPLDVLMIQLNSLKDNNKPYEDAGIEQTWEFAHPNNRKFTGPLNNFIRMIKNPSYSMMIDHLEHNIIPVEEKETSSYYFVELTDINGKKYGFEWTVEKVSEIGEFKDCWMTVGVSRPMPLSQAS